MNGAPPAARSGGMTLVELMIATVAGILVIGAVLVLYMNAQESAAYINSASRVQESGRFATDHIARTLRMAGYDDPLTTGTTPVTPAIEGRSSTESLIVNLFSGFTLKSGTDAVRISHEGAPQVRDCRGVEVGIDSWVTNTYAVSRNNELLCSTSTTTTTITCSGFGGCTTSVSTVSGDAMVIAEGVEDLLMLYGVDADGDGVANRYVPESSVTSWASVVSARAALLINSVENVFADTLHGCESCNTFNPAQSNLLRAEFHTTVNFRNL